jgi:hypothetical protein
MTASNRPQSVAHGQPWTPGAAPKGVSCPACGLTNEPGARTCRNCGLPIAGADDPVRGVAPGRVDLPKVRRSGVSASIGFVMVIVLLLAGGTLAFTGGGGLLSSGGRFFGAAASPSPTPAPVVAGDPDSGQTNSGGDAQDGEVLPKANATKFDYTCEDAAIKDLSRGKWFLSDVQAGLRTADDGTQYDQVYWQLSRTTTKNVKNPTTVTMQWSTPQALQDRFDIGRVQGKRAILVTFNGPVDIASDQRIETGQFEDEGIDQIKRVQMFERNGKVRTAIGIKEDSCARMKANGWAKKKDGETARVSLDIERVYE